MPKVFYLQPDGTERAVEGAVGDSVMATAVKNGVRGIIGQCGGTLSCATCHVYLDQPVAVRLGARSADEEELLADAEGFRECGSRLSCQIAHDEELDGIRVELAPES